MIQKLYSKNTRPEDMERIISILQDGGVIIYPTDTVYAIGCHALHVRAVERICRIKGIDPKKKSLSVICSDLSHISEYAKVSNDVFKLMKHNLPGAFTFVLPASSNLPKIFRNRKEVGIRVPDHPIVLDICRMLNAPILTTSVPWNVQEDPGYLSDPELIDERWGEQVDLVIDGGIGGLEFSTIVNCTGDEPEITRQGAGWLQE